MSGGAVTDLDPDWYIHAFLREIPRTLTLIDRDPTSPTYGCCDRNYWHYRTQDFPSGMYQELGLALALAHARDLPDNPWRGCARLRELALATVAYQARSSHRNGSCDDYFPNEQALGATAFTAAAGCAVLLELDERDDRLLAFLDRRVRWLLASQETGRLANHQALVALAALRLERLTGAADLRVAARERLALCLSWQHDEGWFAEYEGADPGYQSLTLSYLAAVRAFLPGPELESALAKGAIFAAHFLHPDGSYAGEFGSRNTCQTLPSGWERLADTVPAARFLADGWLRGAIAGRRGESIDDRIFCHYLADYVEAWQARRNRGDTDPGPWSWPDGRTDFPAARLHLVRERGLHLVVATNKGGTLRAYRGQERIVNDTGPVVAVAKGKRLVTHLVDEAPAVAWDDDGLGVTVSGRMHRTGRKLATPFKLVVFRFLNATVGRISANLLRSMLQKILITGKKPAPVTFRRRLRWAGDELKVEDELVSERGPFDNGGVWSSSDATSIYVATSNLWQEASRQAWTRHDEAGQALAQSGRCTLIRRFAAATAGEPAG